MEINKFTTKVMGDEVRLTLPIQKVDVERRTVSGFATLDNVDKHGDVVSAKASVEAFKSFRGNIREMHMPKAVGKMVHFEEKTYSADGQDYSGVFVEVYVSKGAQDTWEKCLDGTLSGFSIGGNIDPTSVSKIEKEDGSSFRVIDKYSLVELSLVDNPANQFANVFSIQKVDEGFTFSGFATEDEETPLEVEAPVDEAIEKVDVIDLPDLSQEDNRMEKFFDKMEDFFTKTFGGNSMTTKTEETAVVEEVVETETEEVVETTVEKAADVSEVEVEAATPEPAYDIEAIVTAAVEKVLERLNASVEETTDKVVNEDTNEDLVAVEKSEDSEALANALSELTKAVQDLKVESNERFDALENNTAVQKSLVTGTTRRTSNEAADFWGNSALGGTKTSA